MIRPTRLIDGLCDLHRTYILDARLWPEDLRISGVFASYLNCGDCTNQPLAPHQFDLAETAAFHEAGHAVMYTAAGIAVDYARIDPTGAVGESGHVRFQAGTVQTDAFLAGAWGGVMALLHWLDRTGQLTDATLVDMVATGYEDAAFARRHVRDLGGGDTARVEALVVERWPAIERVADMLLVRGRLTGDEIADLAGLERCTQ